MIRDGILLGISLSFVIGPLFFSILQASLENGFRAGIATASGMWVSDLCYIAAVVFALNQLTALAFLPNFPFYAGLLGGSILIAFGLVGLFSKNNKPADHKPLNPTNLQTKRSKTHYFFKGFLLNAINPGTVFFWIGISTGYIFPHNLNPTQVVVFFAAMMLTLILTDTLKAYGAKHLRNWMTPTHIAMLQRGIGAVLVVFGVVLTAKALLV